MRDNVIARNGEKADCGKDHRKRPLPEAHRFYGRPKRAEVNIAELIVQCPEARCADAQWHNVPRKLRGVFHRLFHLLTLRLSSCPLFGPNFIFGCLALLRLNQN